MNWVGLVWRAPESNDALPIRVERGLALDAEWILVVVDVCDSSQMALIEPLERNVALTVGAYAVERDRIVLRAALPLNAGAADTVARLVQWLGTEAARRRAALRQFRPSRVALLGLFAVD